MAEVKWIKICTDIFDDEKIALIDGMPDRDGIIVIWFKLLCMAGRQNNGGVFMLNDKIAYTDEMLATIFRRPLNTVRLALNTFESFGMIEVVNNTYTIPNWEKHQSLDKLETAKEKNRQRVAKHREKQKQLAQSNDYSNVTVTESNTTDIEEDKDKDKDKDKEKGKKERKKTGYDEILSQITDDSLRELYLEYIKMRKMIKAPMTDRALTMLIKKVKELEPQSIYRQKKLLETAIINNWKSVYPLKDAPKAAQGQTRSYDLDAWERMSTEKPLVYAKDSEDLQARADALKQKLAGG